VSDTYATLEQMKAAVRFQSDFDDSLLETALEAATTWINGWCDRSFYAAGTAVGAVTSRDYIPTGLYDPLQIDDAVEIVSVKIDDNFDRTFSVTLRPIDFQVEPLNQTTYGIVLPFTRLRPFEDGYWPTFRNQATVRVEARYGWPEVPDAVREACILQASRLFTRLDAPLGIAGFGDLGGMRVSRFADPDVELLLGPYRRVRYA
jgi:hypothetical protein